MKAALAKTALLISALLLFTGCAPSGGGTATSSPPVTATAGAQPAATITIKDFGYGGPITVAPGATVAVTNMDSAGHTVTSDKDAAFDVKVSGHGGTGTLTAPAQSGTYPYHCSYHPDMHGTLIVK